MNRNLFANYELLHVTMDLWDRIISWPLAIRKD